MTEIQARRARRFSMWGPVWALALSVAAPALQAAEPPTPAKRRAAVESTLQHAADRKSVV